MKKVRNIILTVIAFAIVSACTDYTKLDYTVPKPENVALLEMLNQYGDLKTYVNRSTDPNFKLGAAIALSDYTAQGVTYRLINRNFDEIVLGNEMKNASVVQADGSLNVSAFPGLFQAAQDAGISVYGHTLVWHAQQNAKYYNSLIAPTIIPGTGGPSLDPSVITNSTFDTDISGWIGWGLQSSHTWAQGQGPDGTNAMLYTNPTAGQSWEAQVAYDFPTPLVNGDTYELDFKVKADNAATISANMQDPSNYAGDGNFGNFNLTTDWQDITSKTTITGDNAKRFLFNLGNYVGNIWFSNITLRRVNPTGGGGTNWVESVTNGDFATNDLSTSFYFTSNANPQIVNDPDKGRVMEIQSPDMLTNDWDLQFWVLINPMAKLGDTYKFSMDVRSDAACSFPTQSHYKPQDYIYWDMVGTINSTTSWTTYTYNLTIDANRIGTRDGVGAIAFNLGHIQTNVYIKNVSLKKEVQNTGDQTVEKTPEEKKEILTGALETWIKGMKEACTYVKAWDVVNEPMSDWPDVTQLKTGVGNANLGANDFYWQDYLGKDYAATAIQLARKYGNKDDKLFINDYGLESNTDKCKGLIKFVAYTDSVCQIMGVKGVDGIGTQMHTDITADTAKIVQMFQLLAATGKQIRISELDMGVGVSTEKATDSMYIAQAKLYEFIVKKYFEIIPVAQRYGITQWSLTDSPTGSGWRPDEPIGLWTLDYSRKRAYGGFANGLAGKDVSAGFK